MAELSRGETKTTVGNTIKPTLHGEHDHRFLQLYLATGIKEVSRTDVSTARPITGRPTSLSRPAIFTSKNDFALLELDFHGHQDHPLGGQCLTCLLLQLDFHRHEWSFHSLANTRHPPHQWEAATNRMKGLHV